jgi:hypothetical protein
VLRLLLAALVGAAVATAVAAMAVPATTRPGDVVRITDVQVALRTVGGSPGRPGAVEIVQQRLYKPSLAHPIGRGDLICTYVDRRARQCSGTYSLPRGKIMVGGAINSRLLCEYAVVGGTGLYDNARGTLTVTSTGLKPRREVLVFRLAG